MPTLAKTKDSMSSSAASRAQAGILPTIPSNTQIILPAYNNLCALILNVVSENRLHLAPRKLAEAEHYLWASDDGTGDGPLDGQFSKWSPQRISRSIRDRVKKILSHYGIHDCAYPSQLQLLAKRILDESESEEVARTLAREEATELAAAREQANNHYEGQLGLTPAARGTVPPSNPGAGAASHEQAVAAAALLGQNPRSPNNTGKRKRKRSQREIMLLVPKLTIFPASPGLTAADLSALVSPVPGVGSRRQATPR